MILHFTGNVPILFAIHKRGFIENYWQYLSTLDLKEQRLELSSSGTMSILCKQTVKMENSTRKLIVNMENSTRKQIVKMENSTRRQIVKMENSTSQRTSNYQRTIELSTFTCVWPYLMWLASHVPVHVYDLTISVR